jgi:hypothetical protein
VARVVGFDVPRFVLEKFAEHGMPAGAAGDGVDQVGGLLVVEVDNVDARW